jgi:hypothetical protein
MIEICLIINELSFLNYYYVLAVEADEGPRLCLDLLGGGGGGEADLCGEEGL